MYYLTVKCYQTILSHYKSGLNVFYQLSRTSYVCSRMSLSSLYFGWRSC